MITLRKVAGSNVVKTQANNTIINNIIKKRKSKIGKK